MARLAISASVTRIVSEAGCVMGIGFPVCRAKRGTAALRDWLTWWGRAVGLGPSSDGFCGDTFGRKRVSQTHDGCFPAEWIGEYCSSGGECDDAPHDSLKTRRDLPARLRYGAYLPTRTGSGGHLGVSWCVVGFALERR